MISQGRNLFELSQKISYVKLLKCKTWVVFSCNHLRWNNIYTFLQIKRIHLITYFLLSRVRICNGSSKLPPRSVNNALPIVSIKEWSLSLESLNRDYSFGCKHMQPLSEGKGIFTFFLSVLSARSVKLIVVFIIEGPFLSNLELYQLILSYLMLAFQS